MQSRLFRVLNALLLCGLVSASHQVVAASTTLHYQGAAYGSLNGTIRADFNPLKNGLESKKVAAGGFDMLETSTGQSLIAWCVDVFHSLNDQFEYTIGNPSSLNRFDDLQKLANQRYAQVTDKTTSVAFQLAIWEIVTDTGGGYSLANGAFKASGFGNAQALAGEWLKLDGQNTGNYKISYFYDGILQDKKSSQNLITVSSVPLPGTALLMLSALGFGAVVRRRRRIA
ncbi:MAG TPA: hypothetical protein VLG17_10285 [Pseudomonas sp.]|uniref:hypothetical protein n=1 Tax=Pseudomonas sp. TaxID=306 RepID=UPI002C077C36|nr:hypothetical protein [Pseudomonas sp.]HSX88376.1 hypothetical protein [Pseudomonas sp.]